MGPVCRKKKGLSNAKIELIMISVGNNDLLLMDYQSDFSRVYLSDSSRVRTLQQSSVPSKAHRDEG